ncbi:hypothetical protein GC207_13580 [bacterium]|nr:hypothetical protein [bacterium]
MANIGSRVFNLVSDKYLSLANEEWVRTLAIGSNWTKLRVGVLLALTPDGTNNLAGTNLLFGLCAGKTNPFGAATTTNFLGMKFGANASSDPLTYVANSGNPYYWSGRGVIKKVGATVTSSDGNGLEWHRIATNTGTLQRRSLQFLEITKGSPNFSVTFWNLTATGVAKDFTPAHLLDGLEQAGSITVNGEALGTGLANSVAFNETAGALDSVNLFWNKSAFPLEVHAIAAYRLA